MKNDNTIQTLFQYAADYRFCEFDMLFSQMEADLPPDAFFEAYLLRAQIKLYTTDLTLLADLRKAEAIGGTPRFPLLKSKWKGDSPNRFIAFPSAPGALKAFLDSLPQIQDKLSLWYGAQGHIAARQIEYEIYYFMGKTEKARALAAEQYTSEAKNNEDAIWALITQYRCNLALAAPQKAEENMFDIIRYAKAYPECVDIYKTFRAWVNLTTGWNGDSLRFYEDEEGQKQPIFKDRLEGIKMGIARTTSSETPFVAYAEHSYTGALMLRQIYMMVFHAMYWLSMNDCKLGESYFIKTYEIVQASGIVMPFIESGEQVMPLLNYVKEKAISCPPDWLEDMTARVMQYEECLRLYRSESDCQSK